MAVQAQRARRRDQRRRRQHHGLLLLLLLRWLLWRVRLRNHLTGGSRPGDGRQVNGREFLQGSMLVSAADVRACGPGGVVWPVARGD